MAKFNHDLISFHFNEIVFEKQKQICNVLIKYDLVTSPRMFNTENLIKYEISNAIKHYIRT